MSGAPTALSDPLANPPALIADGQTPEAPQEAALESYAKDLEPAYGSAFQAGYQGEMGPGLLQREYERGAAPDASFFQRFLRDPMGTPLYYGQDQGRAPMLPADEINRRYAPEGTKITDEPMTEEMGS